MSAAAVIGFLSVLVIAVPGGVLILKPSLGIRLIQWTRGTPAGRLGVPLTKLRDALGRIFGPVLSFVVLAAAGTAIVVAISWLAGEWVAELEDPVDWPIFRWMESHQVSWWTDPMRIATGMGDRPQIFPVSVAACAVLALLAPCRRWVPVVLVLSVVLTQHYTQLLLAELVDRGHPPTSAGTYPSGALSRILADYGLIVFIASVYARQRGWRAGGRRGTIAAWTFIAAFASFLGYTRIYLGRHWFTDVVGGVFLGLPLLLAFVFASRPLLGEDPGYEQRPASS